MEVGHMLDSNGRLCGCGCAAASSAMFRRAAGLEEHRPAFPYSPGKQAMEPSTAAIWAAQGGDSLARTILSEAGQWLGRAMAVCASSFNLALPVIGGGLGHARRIVGAARRADAVRIRPRPPALRVALKLRSVQGAACRWAESYHCEYDNYTSKHRPSHRGKPIRSPNVTTTFAPVRHSIFNADRDQKRLLALFVVTAMVLALVLSA